MGADPWRGRGDAEAAGEVAPLLWRSPFRELTRRGLWATIDLLPNRTASLSLHSNLAVGQDMPSGDLLKAS